MPHHDQYTVHMQSDFPVLTYFLVGGIYNLTMSKRAKQVPVKSGQLLAQLRKTAGLSQRELARLLGVRQSNIAFWEHSDKPPRSEILPPMAKILGVTVESLLMAQPLERKGGPVGKLRKIFDQVAALPRHQQDKIIEVVSVFLNQFHQSSQSHRSR